ncbi:MAG: hypothetical protein ACOY94_25285 [Bacillota bacterium]
MMIPKKWMTALGAALLTGVLVTGAAFAAGGEKPAKAPLNASEGVQELLTEIQTLRQSRMEQLKADIEALVDKALAEGRITAEEAARLKEGPKRFHQGPRGPFPGQRPGFKEGKGFPLGATEAEVKARLDQAVANGRITQEQADQILKKWQEWQAKKPETN